MLPRCSSLGFWYSGVSAIPWKAKDGGLVLSLASRLNAFGVARRESAVAVEDLRRRVASTLNVSPQSLNLQRWRYSGNPPTIVHCRGKACDQKVFAKVFLADPYPNLFRSPTPWGRI